MQESPSMSGAVPEIPETERELSEASYPEVQAPLSDHELQVMAQRFKNDKIYHFDLTETPMDYVISGDMIDGAIAIPKDNKTSEELKHIISALILSPKQD